LLRLTPMKARLSASSVEGYLRRLSPVGRLDLDDFRALVGQQRAAVRARDVGAQVEHAQAAQRPGGALALWQARVLRGGVAHGLSLSLFSLR